MRAREITESRIKDARMIRALATMVLLESIALGGLLVALVIKIKG